MGDRTIEAAPAHRLGIEPERVAAFYDEHWNRPIALALPRFYRWQFVEPPESEGRDHCMVAMADGEIVGVMGLNPRRFMLGGRAVKAAELTTWVVSPAARGLGAGRAIMNALQREHDLMVGLGISDAAMPIYSTAGFRHLKRIPRFFRVNDLNALRPHAAIERLGERLVAEWTPAEPHAHRAERVAPEALADAGMAMSEHGNLFVRDEAALAWRYGAHPTFEYEAYRVSDPALPSGPGMGVVLRMDAAPTAEGASLSMMHVVDLFGDPAHLAAAIGFADARLRESGAAFADVFMGHSGLAAGFLEAGWFSGMDDAFAQVPHLFYPIELREPATTSYVLWSREDRMAAFDFGRFVMTKGDLDLDRPTLAYYEAHDIRIDDPDG